MGRVAATVLFTDLVSSTELRTQVGEQAVDELGRTHDRVLIEAVGAHEGQVVKGLGDGIMATFAGAADTVAAPVAIRQAIDRLNRTGKTPAPLFGAGGTVGRRVSFDDGAHGTPVIEAARLCAAAAGGEILVSEVVRLLATGAGPVGEWGDHEGCINDGESPTMVDVTVCPYSRVLIVSTPKISRGVRRASPGRGPATARFAGAGFLARGCGVSAPDRLLRRDPTTLLSPGFDAGGTNRRRHERLGAPTWLARTRLECGWMLLTRCQPGEEERAGELLGQALATARKLGLGPVERRAVKLLEQT